MAESSIWDKKIYKMTKFDQPLEEKGKASLTLLSLLL